MYEVIVGKAKSERSGCPNVNLLECDAIIQCLCIHVVLLRACIVTCFFIQTKHCNQTQLFNIFHQCYMFRLNEPSSSITIQKLKKTVSTFAICITNQNAYMCAVVSDNESVATGPKWQDHLRMVRHGRTRTRPGVSLCYVHLLSC